MDEEINHEQILPVQNEIKDPNMIIGSQEEGANEQRDVSLTETTQRATPKTARDDAFMYTGSVRSAHKYSPSAILQQQAKPRH